MKNRIKNQKSFLKCDLKRIDKTIYQTNIEYLLKNMEMEDMKAEERFNSKRAVYVTN